MPREQYEIRWKDYYEILQVHPRASAEVIAAAYRRLAQMYHPDRNGSSDATEKFKAINEANEVLSDPQRRARYDQVYSAAQDASSTSYSAHTQYEDVYAGRRDEYEGRSSGNLNGSPASTKATTKNTQEAARRAFQSREY